MPHKLEIKMTLDPLIGIDKKAKGFFKERFMTRDMIRGLPCEITLEATNVGENWFPGGTLEATYGFSGGFKSTPPPRDIPPIGVRETKGILNERIMPLNDGGGVLLVKLKSRDGDKIEAYQRRPDAPIGTNAWQDAYYVVPREKVDFLWFFNLILDELKRLEKR